MKLFSFLNFLCIIVLTGKVVSVYDGDTFTLLTPENKQVKVRLHGIDAPERRQPFGPASREKLADMVFRKEVKVKVLDKDHYGRTIGAITDDQGRDVNREMVASGMAWWYEKYAPKDRELKQAQAAAKKNKLGIWSQENPQSPWDFRKKK